MNANAARVRGGPRRAVVAPLLAFLLTAMAPAGIYAAAPNASPQAAASASPDMTMTPADALCDSVADLRLIIGFLRDIDTSQDGWAPVFVGAIAALSEARQLARSAGDTYPPLVDDLIVSLEGLRSTVDELEERETFGARIAVIGEAMTDVGAAMDALSVQLRSPCPSGKPVAA